MGLYRKPADTRRSAPRAIRVAASDSAKDSASADSQGRSASRAPTLYANMIEQHHEIDQLLSRLVQAVAHINGHPERAQARRLLTRLRKTLYAHISLEDGILFREFESQSGLLLEGPTATLRREHQVLKARIEELSVSIDNGEKTPTLLRLLEAFCALYADHGRREEVMYGICERLLSPELLAKAQTLLRRKPSRSGD